MHDLSVFIVDDDETGRLTLQGMLRGLGCATQTASSGRAALERLAAAGPPPDLVILDVVMPGMDGVETLRRYRAAGGRAAVVMCSALDQTDTVMQAVRAGANDYLTKPLQAEELREVLDRVVGRAPASSVPPVGTDRIGVSPAMRAIDALVDRIADADVPVLLTGESGVGKDVVAREIHARSARASKAFVKINCAALPGELLESELFGHERGSFTGAQRTKPGQFELADAGTLFLDEIGEMPVALQAKLLQALQDGEFYRVGGQRKIRVDARLLVATNVDLLRAIDRGAFREDLYFRLNVVQIGIPPLRERREDIPPLVALFGEKYARRYGRALEVPEEVLRHFETYDFPGNIRELENLVRRLIVLGDPRYVLGELKDRVRPASPPAASPSAVLPTPTPAALAVSPSTTAIAEWAGARVAVEAGEDFRIDLKELGRRAANAAEREAIVVMLRRTAGNKREAAERLGISYKAILYKIRDYGIGRPRPPRRPAPPSDPGPPVGAMPAEGVMTAPLDAGAREDHGAALDGPDGKADEGQDLGEGV